ncbi:MAG: TRAP transporter large permease subunit [Alphaproteobacteria bacterium]|nr:TRAP transporter large permease subunit [Alphaproteobacteria bacterium]
MTGVAVFTVAMAMVIYLGLGVWVSLALYAVAITSLALLKSMPVEKLVAQLTFNTVNTPEILALPLFILMADILFHTRLSESLFRGLAPWASRLPGRLLHVNVLGCTMFAAICGSSAATAAAVGRITLTELFRRGYDRQLVIGSLAGAGTLGFLIPPSIIMIIYGVLAEESILKLFIAGIIPGLLLAGSFMAFIAIRALLNPSLVQEEGIPSTWLERIVALKDLFPIAFLIIIIMGSMYGGFASPTEAAAVGVFGALLIGVVQRTLNLANLTRACISAMRTTSMIALIICGAIFLSVSMGFLGVPRYVATTIAELQLSPLMLIALLIIFYLILGCFLDGLSAIVMTLPITLPLVLLAGYDKIWFGVFLVIMVEMAQITPPVGFNLYVLQGLTGESMRRVSRAAFPFFLLMTAFAMLLAFVPELATYLPTTMSQQP